MHGEAEWAIPGVPVSGSGGPSPAGQQAQALFDLIEAATLKLQTLDWDALTEAESRTCTTRSFIQKQRHYAVYLHAVRNLDDRPDAVAGARRGKGCHRYLTESSIHRTCAQAHRDLDAAHTLTCPDADPATGGLPRLGAAIAAGTASEEHGRVALTMLKKIPRKLLSQLVEDKDDPDPWTEGRARVGGDIIDELLTEQALAHRPDTVEAPAKQMLRALDPNGEDGFDPDATERRELTLHPDSTGMIIGRFQLDPATGEWLMTAIDTYSAPEPKRTEVDENGNKVTIIDKRTAAQRRADALATIARIALTAQEAGTRGAERPRIIIQTGLDDLTDVTNPDDTDNETDQTTTTEPEAEPDRQDTPAHNESPHPGPQAGAAENHQPDQTQPEPSAPSAPSDNRYDNDSGDAPDHDQNAETPRPPAPPGPNRHRRRHQPPKQHRGDRARYGDRTPSTPIGYPRTSTGHLVPPRLLGRYACDAVLQAVTLTTNGELLNLGRDVRTVTPAQRRALVARDGGCVIAGCTAPAHLCEAHHVTWYRNGGLTDIANLALTCHRHHTDIHTGTWKLEMRSGIPWSRPPAWIHPNQPWLRNTYHQTERDNRNTGTQLRLNSNHG